MAKLLFTKMQGLGNDFMVVDATKSAFDFSTEQIQSWADRHFGIGFDQLLVVEPAQQPGVDFRYRIFNADGSEVQQCGNGARCFARFVYDKELTDKTEITVETASGIIVLYIEGEGVRVNMGAPDFEPSSLPFVQSQLQPRYEVKVEKSAVTLGAVSMGNPHAVIQVENIESAPVERLGAILESHPLFPERVNVGFVEKVNGGEIMLRVYERGAAETLACGTGACAAMVVLRKWQEVDDSVTVRLPGGNLKVEWDGKEDSVVWMTGPAETVFEGSLEI